MVKDRTYSLEEADLAIKNSGGRAIPKYSLFDVILLVLYADKDSWIFGKVQFMKEIFLAYKEIFLEQPIQQVIFTHYKYGPFSEEIENVLDDMAFANYVIVQGIGNSKSIKISEKGIGYIRDRFEGLPEPMKQSLIANRISWDSNPDIKYYTYRRYDDYLDNSVFKERYKGGKWKGSSKESKK
jgi:hypothetical protein